MKESVGSPSFGCEASEPHDSEPATSTSEHFLSRPFAWVAENVGPCVLAVARSSTNEAVPVPTYGSPDGLLGAFKHLTREFSWSGRRESNSRSQLGNHAEAELADDGEQERQVSDLPDAGERPRTNPDVP